MNQDDYNVNFYYFESDLGLPACNVCAPIGGFANHIRWLLFLDPSIRLYITPTERRYNIFKGEDWPSYHDFVKGNYSGTLPHIQKEIQLLADTKELPRPIDVSTIDTKIEFIKQNIYGDFRTWSNWLAIEWQYRNHMSPLIGLTHEYDLMPMGNEKTALFTIDPMRSYRLYLKFNSNLNCLPPDKFRHMIRESNIKHRQIAQDNNLLIQPSDHLYKETLDPEFYQTLVDYLGMQNMYSYANEIHGIWYQLHLKSEKEFVSFVNDFYK